MIDPVDAARREVFKINYTAGNVSGNVSGNISAMVNIDLINMTALGEPYGMMQRKERKGSWKVVSSVSKKEKVERG